MAIDYSWMTGGGVLSDYSGDIAFTSNNQGTLQLVISRLKAAINGWKLYAIGAGLDAYAGTTIDSTLQQALESAVNMSLTNQFLPNGSFTVQSSVSNNEIDLYIFMNSALIAQASVDSNGNVSVTQVAQ